MYTYGSGTLREYSRTSSFTESFGPFRPPRPGPIQRLSCCCWIVRPSVSDISRVTRNGTRRRVLFGCVFPKRGLIAYLNRSVAASNPTGRYRTGSGYADVPQPRRLFAPWSSWSSPPSGFDRASEIFPYCPVNGIVLPYVTCAFKAVVHGPSQ